MRRFFLNTIDSEFAVLEGDDHNHISSVLRLRAGDELNLSIQDGYDYKGIIEQIDKKSTLVKIKEKVKSMSEPEMEITVFQAVPKGDKLELVVQKCSELGVINVTPFMSEFVSSKSEVKTERLNKISLEASKQNGRNRVLKVNPTLMFSQMLTCLKDFDLVLFPYEREQQISLKDVLTASSKPKRLAVIIGSEGGFSKDEARLIQSENSKALTLGRRILRTETVALSVISAVMYHFDEWKY